MKGWDTFASQKKKKELDVKLLHEGKEIHKFNDYTTKLKKKKDEQNYWWSC